MVCWELAVRSCVAFYYMLMKIHVAMTNCFVGVYNSERHLKLGEVRSLVPGHVNLTALTATATKATRAFVIEKLGLCNPVLVYKSPNKP